MATLLKNDSLKLIMKMLNGIYSRSWIPIQTE